MNLPIKSLKKITSIFLCATLILSMTVGLTGCKSSGDSGNATKKEFKSSGKSVNLMEGIKKSADNSANTDADLIAGDTTNFTDFSVELFKKSASDKNTLISPLSIIMALSMAMNGADGNTLKQYEDAFGVSIEEINNLMAYMMSNLQNDENSKLSLANSIWIKDDDGLTVNKDFLQTNADFYGAGVFKSPFDEGTIADINKWVSQNTDGMIPQMLDKIDKDSIMFLINALCFDAKWDDPFLDVQVSDGEFLNLNGTKKKVSFMTANESTYIETQHATGFAKPYYNDRYAFVGILPNDDIPLSEYIDKYSKDDIKNAFAKSEPYAYNLPNSAESTDFPRVNISMPKFKTEFSMSLNNVLKDIGITDAFDNSQADFTKLGKHVDGNIYIGNVLHKTFIEVGEQGTKAGAATSVEMVKEMSAAPTVRPKTVRLDRPFLYLIVDTKTDMPIFIGSVTEL